MKVRIAYTMEVDDDIHRAVNAYYGISGLATHNQVARFFRHHGENFLDQVMIEYNQQQGDEK